MPVKLWTNNYVSFIIVITTAFSSIFVDVFVNLITSTDVKMIFEFIYQNWKEYNWIRFSRISLF